MTVWGRTNLDSPGGGMTSTSPSRLRVASMTPPGLCSAQATMDVRLGCLMHRRMHAEGLKLVKSTSFLSWFTFLMISTNKLFC